MTTDGSEPKPEIRRSSRIRESTTRTKNMQNDSKDKPVKTKSNKKSEKNSESKNYLNSKPKTNISVKQTQSMPELKKKTDSEYKPLMSSFPLILAINTLTISMIIALGFYKGKLFFDV